MKRILFLSSAIVIGFCLHPASLHAQDQGPTTGDKKDAEASPKGGKKVAHVSKNIDRGGQDEAVSRSDKSYGKSGDSATTGAFISDKSAKLSSKAISASGRKTIQGQSSRRQTTALVVQGNQANHYNGHWFSASSHSDWDQQTDHRWRNHDYRWYDGGWLMIDVSSGPGYETTGSIGANVQASLAQQGYYDGPIDGDIGRGTRHAISHYESDNGLQVNGQIDEPLLVSLRLE
jgi:hypothetical protein